MMNQESATQEKGISNKKISTITIFLQLVKLCEILIIKAVKYYNIRIISI